MGFTKEVDEFGLGLVCGRTVDPEVEVLPEDRLGGYNHVPQINKLFWGIWFTCHFHYFSEVVNRSIDNVDRFVNDILH